MTFPGAAVHARGVLLAYVAVDHHQSWRARSRWASATCESCSAPTWSQALDNLFRVLRRGALRDGRSPSSGDTKDREPPVHGNASTTSSKPATTGWMEFLRGRPAGHRVAWPCRRETPASRSSPSFSTRWDRALESCTFSVGRRGESREEPLALDLAFARVEKRPSVDALQDGLRAPRPGPAGYRWVFR